MTIKKSSHYRTVVGKEKPEFVCRGVEYQFNRVFAGISFPSTMIIIGESGFHANADRFILAECREDHSELLFDDAAKMQKEFDISDYFSSLTPWAEDFVKLRNAQRFHKGLHDLFIQAAPGAEVEKIDYEINAIKSQLLSRKKLFFFGESSLPAELSSLPDDTRNTKAVDSPGVAALGYALTAMLTHEPAGEVLAGCHY